MDALTAALANSLRAIRFAAQSERALRQEFLVLALAVPAALALTSDLWVRVALVGSILFVLAVEFLNTAVEKLCDHVTPRFDPAIGLVKDLGSAAVLCALALAALVWGAAVMRAVGV